MCWKKVDINKLVFGLSDRMNKALRTSDVSNQEMADYLGVSRGTITNWTSGRSPVKKQTLRLWAIKTKVPLIWLETGQFENSESSDAG